MKLMLAILFLVISCSHQSEGMLTDPAEFVPTPPGDFGSFYLSGPDLHGIRGGRFDVDKCCPKCKKCKDDELKEELKEAEEEIKRLEDMLEKNDEFLRKAEKDLEDAEEDLEKAEKDLEKCQDKEECPKCKKCEKCEKCEKCKECEKCEECPPEKECPDKDSDKDDDKNIPPPEETADGALKDLFEEMNKIRSKYGAGPLVLNPRLNCAAKKHSEDIGRTRRCSHTGSDGSSPWKRAERCGIKAYGEIVACGQGTPKAAIDAWFKSSGHRNLMLNKKFKKVGVGMKNNYWTAIFAY